MCAAVHDILPGTWPLSKPATVKRGQWLASLGLRWSDEIGAAVFKTAVRHRDMIRVLGSLRRGYNSAPVPGFGLLPMRPALQVAQLLGAAGNPFRRRHRQQRKFGVA